MSSQPLVESNGLPGTRPTPSTLPKHDTVLRRNTSKGPTPLKRSHSDVIRKAHHGQPAPLDSMDTHLIIMKNTQKLSDHNINYDRRTSQDPSQRVAPTPLIIKTGKDLDSSLPLISQLPSSTMPRRKRTEDSSAHFGSTFSEMSDEDVQNLQIGAIKRLSSLFKSYKLKPPDVSLLKNVQHCSQGISTKRKWLFPLFRREKLYETQQTTTVFHTHLCKSIFYASIPYGQSDSPLQNRRIPILVYECIKYFKLNGYHSNGLFRVNGSEKRMAKLTSIFDTPPAYGLDFDFQGYTPFDVADFLKKYLRNLPEPLMSSELYPFFLRVLEIPPGDDRIYAIRLLLIILPSPHLVLFECILNVICNTVQKSQQNQMTAHNMARIFAPTLLRPKCLSKVTSPLGIAGPSLDEYEKSAQLIEYIIEHASEFRVTGRHLNMYTILDQKRLECVSDTDEGLVRVPTFTLVRPSVPSPVQDSPVNPSTRSSADVKTTTVSMSIIPPVPPPVDLPDVPHVALFSMDVDRLMSIVPPEHFASPFDPIGEEE